MGFVPGMHSELKNAFQKFRPFNFREHQEEAVEFIIDSAKPIVIVQAPTGSGKSLIGMCAGESHLDFTYLVSSKQLQAQLVEDFPEVAVMQGRNNYRCAYNPDFTCDDCLHGTLVKCPYYKGGCPYEIEKKKVLASRRRLLNYAYYLFETNYVGKFSGADILICDEGDLLESLLADFISLNIPMYAVNTLKIPKPKYVTAEASQGVECWIEWAGTIVMPKIKDRILKLNDQIESSDIGDPDLLKRTKEKKRYDGLYARLEIFVANVNTDWIFEESERNGYAFKPIWTPIKLAEHFFFRTSKKFVLMSATFPPGNIMGQLLGRHPGDFDYYEIPSTFPVKNRQVFVRSAGDLTYKTFKAEAPKVVDAIGKIISEHPNEKGLVHAVSYKLSEMIMNLNGDVKDRLITHESKNREQVLERFKSSEYPLVLVSPSMERGVNLPDDLCQFIIFAKAPFLSLADKLVKRRVFGSNIGGLWYRSTCAQTIVQGCGRGVRHKDDYCVTYLVDKQILRLIVDNRKLFPNYWLEAVEM